MMEDPVVRFRLITLDEITFQRGEVTKVAFHPIMLACYAAFIVALILLDANGTGDTGSLLAHVAAYSVGTSVAIAFIIGGLRLAELRAKRGTPVTLNGSIICFGASLVGMVAGEAVARSVIGRSTLDFVEGVVLVAFYYGVTELVLVFLTAYILPRVQARVRVDGPAAPRMPQMTAEAPPAPTATPPANLPALPSGGTVTVLPKRPAGTLQAGALRIAIGDILRVEAEGNYVRIVTSEARALLPGPFSRVVRQLEDAEGQVINRSCWVAASAVVAHRRQGRDLYLLLDDGTEAKVATGRRDAVKAWLSAVGTKTPLRAG